MSEILIQNGIFIGFYMSSVFILAIILRNNSIVDIFWGLGFIVVMMFNADFRLNDNIAINLFNFMILIWGLRLSIHIFIRNYKKEEDFRYKKWRETWKYFYLRSFFQIYMLQGFIMWIVSIPITKTNHSPETKITTFFIAGLILFVTGLLFESISDYQLLNFKSNIKNKGKIITSGLWKYSRHPNYFGEALLWWGIALSAIGKLSDIYLLISPILITFLLRYVSGVPMLELKYNQRADFIAYSKKTPVFFPFIQKK